MRKQVLAVVASTFASVLFPAANAQGCDDVQLESYALDVSATNSGEASNNHPVPKDVSSEVELLSLMKSQATRNAELANFSEMETFCQSFNPIEHVRSNCEAVRVGDMISGPVWDQRIVNDEPQCSTRITTSETPGRVEVTANCTMRTSSLCRTQRVSQTKDRQRDNETERAESTNENGGESGREHPTAPTDEGNPGASAEIDVQSPVVENDGAPARAEKSEEAIAAECKHEKCGFVFAYAICSYTFSPNPDNLCEFRDSFRDFTYIGFFSNVLLDDGSNHEHPVELQFSDQLKLQHNLETRAFTSKYFRSRAEAEVELQGQKRDWSEDGAGEFITVLLASTVDNAK